MNRNDENLYKTTGLLLMLFRESKLSVGLETEEDKRMLTVDKEHIEDAGLTTPNFLNTLNVLMNAGYVYAVSFKDTKVRIETINFNEKGGYQKILDEIDKKPKEAKKASDKIQKIIGDSMKKLIPQTHYFDEGEYYEEEISLREIILSGKRQTQGVGMSTIAKVFLYPIRDIGRLHRLLGEGISSDNIVDPGIWYNWTEYVFHINDEEVEVSYQGKPNLEHFVLKGLFQSNQDESVFDYDELPEFQEMSRDEKKKRRKKYRDALTRFLDKHQNLPKIFTVHSDHIEINSEYIEQTH